MRLKRFQLNAIQLHISGAGRLRPVVDPIRNWKFVKPNGGFWTSSYEDGSSAWVEECSSMFGDSTPYKKNWFLLKPDPSARILLIDTLSNLRMLLRSWPNPLPGTRIVWPDFEAIARHYDAMHLTAAGQIATRLSHPENLYGWDVESTLWFRWKFLDCERIPTPSESAAVLSEQAVRG